MTAKLIIVIIIMAASFIAALLSHDLFKPHIKRFSLLNTPFGSITLLFLVVICINLGQSLWIISERTPWSFRIPGDTYKIKPRDFSDLNSYTKELPTLYAIQNLYIELDELTTDPVIYSVGDPTPADSENLSKLYGTVRPTSDIKLSTRVDEDHVIDSLEGLRPYKSGTLYSTLKKIDDGVDWAIYSEGNNSSTSELVVFSSSKEGRKAWTFVDTSLLDKNTRERLRK